ncbi:bifunctional DNA primase/polymerase [Brucella sp. MAB-22]|uniref:bifunctional DNA primase/polymerase n=1 Tax=Brucella sp. MAB-22 TaxID=2986424 RepID=UPI00221FCBDD|nr:bifunctional DNA primase/polymerase [Brucella sp. MAB-22]UYT54136.1 bifunctional DNA primase/polymerase [Brucella sp. MAB-22]
MHPNSIVATDPMLDVALSYTTRSWPVFPCRAADEEFVDEDGLIEILATKTPLTSNGFRGATLNERIVRELWRRNPGAMIGVPTGALIGAWVLDIDPKHGGPVTLAALEAEHGALPATLTAETTSGGRHYFFKHKAGVRNRGALGAGIDVRGDGGYVIAAGSVPAIGQPYRWLADMEPVDAPDWLLELVLPRSYDSTTMYQAPSVSGTINDRYVERAVQSELDDLAMEPMGNRNNRLNDAAFRLGTFVGAGALAESEARALLQGVARGWGRDFPRCCKTIDNGLKAGKMHPRQAPEAVNDNTKLVDITRMLDNARAKVDEQREPDAHNVEPDVPVAEEEPADQPILAATPFQWKDPSTLPRREFAFGRHFIRKYVSVTVAPGGLGKTANSIVEALAMASGKALNGVKPPRRLKVWLFNVEDPRDELERRIMAACIHFNLKPEDIDGHLFLDSGREQELVVAIDDKKGVKIQEPIVEAVAETILANGIDVMIVDPFVSTHQVNENDNGAIDKVAKLWAQIADYTNCSIDIVHHLRKVSDREATVEDARGAVALIGAARSVRVLNRMSEGQANEAGIPGMDRFGYFSITYGKSNLTPLSHRLDWRHIESVALGNGRGLTQPQDHAPVVTEWHWPSSEEVAEGMTDEQKDAIRGAVNGGMYKQAPQAKDWVGHAVAYALGLDIDDEVQKKRTSLITKALFKEGFLAKVEERDPVQRKTTSFVRAV